MIRARLFAALFAAVMGLAACNDSALPPGGTYQSISGVVLDAVTNAPIAGATVTVDTVLTAVTDASGRFSFAQVPVGDVDYQVSARGYRAAAPPPVRLDPAKPLVLTITLSH